MNYIIKEEHALNKEQKKHLESIRIILKDKMNPGLFAHTEGTLEFSAELAITYWNKENHAVFDIKAPGKQNPFYNLFIAALLHDYGKIFDYEELLKAAENCRPKLSAFELGCRRIIHSFAAPYLIKRDFNIKNKIISNAVRHHTTGSCSMNIIDKIIYLSDKLEKNREYEGIEVFRELSFKDIDLCLLEVYKSNIMYIIKKNRSLHPMTSKIWNNISGGYENAI